MQAHTSPLLRTRGFSLVEALLAIAILAAAMLAAAQAVMASTHGKVAVQRAREIQQWHSERIVQFQRGTRLATTAPGTLPAATLSTPSGYQVSVIETITLPAPKIAMLESKLTWTVPGGSSLTETLRGLQARP